MKNSPTRELLEQVDQEHDWREGQTRSHGGTYLERTDTCRICSLRRNWQDDYQNGIYHEYRFSDGETGRDLSLRQAAGRGCL